MGTGVGTGISISERSKRSIRLASCLVVQKQLVVISQCSSEYHPLVLFVTDSVDILECGAKTLLPVPEKTGRPVRFSYLPVFKGIFLGCMSMFWASSLGFGV